MRKALSLVLVLALILGSFSMAFAATPTTGLSDIKGNANEDAIKVAYNLGIVTGNPDGTYLPAKAVNRAEFAALITRALAVPDSALAGYTTTKFKDTVGYDWAVKYLAFAETKGIMLGDGQGNAMPGRTITVNEAMTMALRAIGYTSNSDYLVGSYPSNYVTLAQNEGMYDDVAATATVDKANAAQIIYNLLTVEKVKVNSEGTTTPITGKNLLNTGLGATEVPNQLIDGADYAASDINVTDLIGQYGTAYTKDGDLVAFDASSTALEGKMKDGSTTIFVANDVEYTLPGTSASTVAAITNASAAASATLADTLANTDSGKVVLNVKLSGKTISNIYSAVAWKASAAKVVATSDINDIADKTFLTKNFAKNDNGAIDATKFQLVGVASLDKIAKDQIAYVYADNSTIRKIAIGTEVVTGKVTEKGTDFVVVNGKQYKKSSVTGADNLPTTLDATVELSLDAFGKVYNVDTVSKTASKYAVVTGYQEQTGSSFITNAKAKLYTADAATKTFTFVEDEDIDASLAAGAFAAKDLVAYDVDATGYIDTIATSVALTSDKAVTLQSTKVIVIDGVYKNVASDVVVFTYDTDYAVGKIADVKLGVDLANSDTVKFAYMLNSDGDVAAIFMNKTDATTKNTSDDLFGVVNDITTVLNADDKEVNKVVGFADGAAYTSLATFGADVNTSVTPVALYKFVRNAAGVITSATQFTTATSGTNPAQIAAAATIATSGVDTDNNVLTTTTDAKYTVASNAVVYKAVMKAGSTTDVDYYEVSKISNITSADKVWLYDTKSGTDHDGIANVVIFQAL